MQRGSPSGLQSMTRTRSGDIRRREPPDLSSLETKGKTSRVDQSGSVVFRRVGVRFVTPP
jgi:hypothetical protein